MSIVSEKLPCPVKAWDWVPTRLQLLSKSLMNASALNSEASENALTVPEKIAVSVETVVSI